MGGEHGGRGLPETTKGSPRQPLSKMGSAWEGRARWLPPVVKTHGLILVRPTSD